MPKRLTVSPHMSIDELEQCYRHASTVTERSHYQILWLLAKGKPSEEVAEVTGYSRSWIYELVRSYNHSKSRNAAWSSCDFYDRCNYNATSWVYFLLLRQWCLAGRSGSTPVLKDPES